LIAMPFSDFEIRAWKKGTDRVQAVVHRSPAGDTPAPIEVRVPAKRLKDLAAVDKIFNATDAELAEIGGQLAGAVLPDAINGLLDDSLRGLDAGDGLRVRLSLDPALQELPWELLHRAPAVRGRGAGVLDGFLALDPRVSIVRGAPAAADRQTTALDRPRLVFAGALAANAEDHLQVRPEFDGLSRALGPVAQVIALESAIGTAGRVIEQVLSRPTSVFHYAGHAEIEADGAWLVKEFDPRTEKLYANTMATLLAMSSAELAVFTACNSGHPAFAMPLVRAGVPAVIGVHGALPIEPGIAFSGRLYGFLAAGHSIDRAMISARQHVVAPQQDGARGNAEWARPVLYLSARETRPLFVPRTQGDAVSDYRETQHAADRETMNRSELRRAMLRTFNTSELEVICADVQDRLRGAGISDPVSLDIVGAGGHGLERQILELIAYVDRRSWFAYFQAAIVASRPELTKIFA
jgi:hypothetical protein